MRSRDVVLGLGANLGGRRSLLRAGAAMLRARLGDAPMRTSPVWATAPLGPPQPTYFNAGVSLRTDASLDAVLDAALAVEAALGRERRVRWGARTLDIDVLWHDGPPVDREGLTVPHAGLHARAFALAPLLALHPDARDVGGGLLADLAAAQAPPGPEIASSVDAAFATTVLSHTADEGFEVVAADRADLLAAAAEALAAVIVDPASVSPREHRLLRVPAIEVDDETRLVTFLSECLYAFDGDRFAAHRVAVLSDDDEVLAVVVGEPMDESRHRVRTAVKAVTWHELEVGIDPAGRRARVILDL
ncbi:MAG: 2-amino-4-hydroxy-6-hydroxymethyldihydropteridine diphosphokinase [Polyangiales bacterium]